MRIWLTVTMYAALIALGNTPSPLLAQQETVKACQDEWRANKADNQAKGITEKAYVAQCRTRGRSTQPTSAPTPAPPSAATSAPKKTVKACQDEWRANKAAYQAANITERAYVAKCRAGEAVALPTTPTAAPTGPSDLSFCGYPRAKEDCEGLSGRVEGQQGSLPSSKRYREGICRQMSCGRGCCSAQRAGSGAARRAGIAADSDDGLSGPRTALQTRGQVAPDPPDTSSHGDGSIPDRSRGEISVSSRSCCLGKSHFQDLSLCRS
jgi:hypothetical protein